MEHVDAVVVGAGVVGLAVARWLALKGFETLILEAETGYGASLAIAERVGALLTTSSYEAAS